AANHSWIASLGPSAAGGVDGLVRVASRRSPGHGSRRNGGGDERSRLARRNGESHESRAAGGPQFLLPSRHSAAAVSEKVAAPGDARSLDSEAAAYPCLG